MKMGFCIECGKKLGENDLFCTSCGTKVCEVKEASPNDTAENIVFKKAANLFRGKEGVGGQLTITNSRLIFKPHSFNFQTQEEEIFIKDIRSIEKSKNLGFISNGMLVTLKNGNVHRFVVWGPTEIVEYINSRINAC
jgi:hypothetical protein